MSANHHTPIANGANADDTVFNAPLGQLDQTLTDMLDGSQAFTALMVGSGMLNAAALLQIDSTEKGFLMPVLDDTQRDAIATPPEGLLIYNSDGGSPEGYDGSSWVSYLPSGDTLQEIIPTTGFSVSATLQFLSIPASYQDLLLRLRIRSSQVGSESTLLMRFNGDSGASNYAWNWLHTFNLAAGSFNDASDSEVELRCPAASSPSNRYADFYIYIRNYTEASERIHGEIDGVGVSTSSERIWGAFEWVGGAAITQIEIVRAASFAINGSYALYGLGTPE